VVGGTESDLDARGNPYNPPDSNQAESALARILEKTSAWRRSTAAKFPDDSRNINAAEMLDQLAIDAAHLSDDQWNDLRVHFGWASQTWRDGLIQAARLVGFAHKSKDFDAFMRLVVRQLSPVGLAA
jgi:predicted aminopeptidase